MSEMKPDLRAKKESVDMKGSHTPMDNAMGSRMSQEEASSVGGKGLSILMDGQLANAGSKTRKTAKMGHRI